MSVSVDETVASRPRRRIRPRDDKHNKQVKRYPRWNTITLVWAFCCCCCCCCCWNGGGGSASLGSFRTDNTVHAWTTTSSQRLSIRTSPWHHSRRPLPIRFNNLNLPQQRIQQQQQQWQQDFYFRQHGHQRAIHTYDCSFPSTLPLLFATTTRIQQDDDDEDAAHEEQLRAILERQQHQGKRYSNPTIVNSPTTTTTTTISSSQSSSRSMMQACLAIVPPEHAWDTLQRARYIAKDQTYTQWPPAIRLFHPLPTISTTTLSPLDTTDTDDTNGPYDDLALQIATIIEEEGIERFEIHLNQWTVLPHMEAMEADFRALNEYEQQQQQQQRHEDAMTSHSQHSNGESLVSSHDPQQREIDELIRREEYLGRINKLKRDQRKRARQQEQEDNEEEEEEEDSLNNNAESHGPSQSATKTTTTISQSLYLSEGIESPRELMERQSRMYEEFNGPCVVCLEPDEESKERLQQLREILRTKLCLDTQEDLYSPSSSVTVPLQLPSRPLEDSLLDFRPLVPIGAFATVNSAIEMARKLRRLWDPLSFNVTDLHLISCPDTSLQLLQDTDHLSHWSTSSVSSTSSLSSSPSPSFGLSAEDQSDESQFGCDAMIMLMGEEEYQEDLEVIQDMVDLVLKQGEKGGGDTTRDVSKNDDPPAKKNGYSISIDDDEEIEEDEEENEKLDSLSRDLELWLDDDGDFEEGTVVVIGRTHFFRGEMRNYVGMPATSVTDGAKTRKDSTIKAKKERSQQ